MNAIRMRGVDVPDSQCNTGNRFRYSGVSTATIWTLSGIVLAACSVDGGDPFGELFSKDRDNPQNPGPNNSIAQDRDAKELPPDTFAYDGGMGTLTFSREIGLATGERDPDTDEPVILTLSPATDTSTGPDGVVTETPRPTSITLPAGVTDLSMIDEPYLVYLQRDGGTVSVVAGTRTEFTVARGTGDTPNAFIIGVLDPNLYREAANQSVTWHPVMSDGRLHNTTPIPVIALFDTQVTEDDASDNTATGSLGVSDDINIGQSYTFSFSNAETGHRVPVNNQWQGQFGTLTFTPTTDADGNVTGGSWSYALNNDNETVNALGAGESETETIHVQVRDSDGAMDRTVGSEAITITIAGANDAPTIGEAVVVSLRVNSAATDNDYTPFARPADAGAVTEAMRIGRLLNFADDDTGDAVTSIRFTDIPESSTGLTVRIASGGVPTTPVTENMALTLAQIARLVFTVTTADREGRFELAYQVNDGTVWSTDTGAYTLAVSDVPNTAPTVSGNPETVTVGETRNNQYNPFSELDDEATAGMFFGFSDPVDIGDTLRAIRFTSFDSTPGVSITLEDGTAVNMANNEVAFDDIAGLIFTTPNTALGVNPSYSFDYQVSDGEDYSSNSGTFTLTVTGADIVNTNPTGRAALTKTETEDNVNNAANAFTPFSAVTTQEQADMEFGFMDDDDGDMIAGIVFTEAVTQGGITAPTPTIGGTAIDFNILIPWDDLDDLTFTTPDTHGTVSYVYGYRVQDNFGGVSTPNPLTIRVTGANDLPEIRTTPSPTVESLPSRQSTADNEHTPFSGVTQSNAAAFFGFMDRDTDDAFKGIQFVTGTGIALANGTAVAANTTVEVADIPGLVFTAARGTHDYSYNVVDSNDGVSMTANPFQLEITNSPPMFGDVLVDNMPISGPVFMAPEITRVSGSSTFSLTTTDNDGNDVRAFSFAGVSVTGETSGMPFAEFFGARTDTQTNLGPGSGYPGGSSGFSFATVGHTHVGNNYNITFQPTGAAFVELDAATTPSRTREFIFTFEVREASADSSSPAADTIDVRVNVRQPDPVINSGTTTTAREAAAGIASSPVSNTISIEGEVPGNPSHTFALVNRNTDESTPTHDAQFGMYGSLSLDKSFGLYTYTIDDTAANAANRGGTVTLTDTFAFTVQNLEGGVTTDDIEIMVVFADM